MSEIKAIDNIFDAILRQRICKLIPRIEPQCTVCPLNKILIQSLTCLDESRGDFWTWCRVFDEMQDRIKAGVFKLDYEELRQKQREISAYIREGTTE